MKAGRIRGWLLFFVLFAVAGLFAKDEAAQVMVWPETGKPVLRFSFARFREQGPSHSYLTETTVENLWDKKIDLATFSLYLFDKDKIRIGEGYISVSNLGPGEKTRFQTGIMASGTPASIQLSPKNLPAELDTGRPKKLISLTVNTVPQGAALKVDGEDAGTTPKIIHVGVGKHMLDFAKEGFTPGRFPFDVGPDDASGGSVSFEMGALVHDTLEMRDGSVLVCDVESMSATQIVALMDGKIQRIDRNKVKRLILTERDQPGK